MFTAHERKRLPSNYKQDMTALNTSLWFLSDPKHTQKLMARAAKFAVIIQYHGVKPGKTIAIKR